LLTSNGVIQLKCHFNKDVFFVAADCSEIDWH